MSEGITRIISTDIEDFHVEIEDKGEYANVRMRLRGMVLVSKSYFHDDYQRLRTLLDEDMTKRFLGGE